MLGPADFFDLAAASDRAVFDGVDLVWGALGRIERYLEDELARRGPSSGRVDPGAFVGPDVHLGDGVRVETGAYVAGPTVVGEGSVVRHGAYVRGMTVVGRGCIVGHATEVKGSIMLDGSAAPHFAYVGDSILGLRVNLGAGTKLSNFSMLSVQDPRTGEWPTIRLLIGGQAVDTGLPKLGAVLGDDVQLGCNAVANPGCLIGPRTVVYAGVALPKGLYAADRMIKLRQELLVAERRR